jgi:hypothetical protein
MALRSTTSRQIRDHSASAWHCPQSIHRTRSEYRIRPPVSTLRGDASNFATTSTILYSLTPWPPESPRARITIVGGCPASAPPQHSTGSEGRASASFTTRNREPAKNCLVASCLATRDERERGAVVKLLSIVVKPGICAGVMPGPLSLRYSTPGSYGLLATALRTTITAHAAS